MVKGYCFVARLEASVVRWCNNAIVGRPCKKQPADFGEVFQARA